MNNICFEENVLFKEQTEYFQLKIIWPEEFS